MSIRLAPNAPHVAELTAILTADPIIGVALRCACDLRLADWMIVSGAIYQTVWNALTGRPSGHGLRDIDLVYFDAGDPSFEAEDAVIRRAARAFSRSPIPVEVRNQARVHLWFEQRFGIPVAPLRSTVDGLRRYASVAHAVGVRIDADGQLEVHAPFGLDDVFGLRLRPNRVLANGPSHDAKALRMKEIWPELEIELW